MRRKTLHGAVLLRLLVVAAMVDISKFVSLSFELEAARQKEKRVENAT